MPRPLRAFRLPAVIATALAGAALLDLRLADSRLSRPYDVVHVPSGRVARVAALGHRTLLSDLYWLAAVQYVGDARADARGYDKLFPIVDLVTDLDPRHGYAYQMAGIVLSAAGRIDDSNAILEKGIRLAPRWTFPFYISFNHWFYRGDLEEAARWAEVAARLPGASPNISHLALALAAKSGSPERAIELLAELRRSVTDAAVAERIEAQMKLAILERDAQALERAAERYRAEKGPLVSIEELRRAGYLRELPEDPFGGHYTLDPADGRVRSSVNPFRFTFREGPHEPKFHYQPSGKDIERALR